MLRARCLICLMILIISCTNESQLRTYYSIIKSNDYPLKARKLIFDTSIEIKYCPVLFNVLNEVRSYSLPEATYDSIYNLYKSDVVLQLVINDSDMKDSNLNSTQKLNIMNHSEDSIASKMFLITAKDTLTFPAVHKIADGKENKTYIVIFGKVKENDGFKVYLRDIIHGDIQSTSYLEILAVSTEELKKYNRI